MCGAQGGPKAGTVIYAAYILQTEVNTEGTQSDSTRCEQWPLRVSKIGRIGTVQSSLARQIQRREKFF